MARVVKSSDKIQETENELAKTIAAARKKYGEGVVVKGNSIKQPTRIPTGIFTLDLATLGGIPRNRCTMVYGARHSGKSLLTSIIAGNEQKINPDLTVAWADIENCIAEDSRILDTDTGQIYTAREIYEGRIKVTPLSFNIETEQLEPQTIQSFFDNGVKTVVQISTVNSSIKVTKNHKMLVYMEGEFIWVRADELTTGMYLCRPRVAVNRKQADGDMQPYEAKLMGYILGDGYVGGRRESIHFTKKDKTVLAEVETLCSNFGIGLVRYSDIGYRLTGTGQKPKHNRWNRNPITLWLEKCGIKGLVSGNKIIPKEVFNSHMEMECLSGLYTTDGTVHKSRPTVGYCTTSLDLAEQVRYIWSLYGVVARIYKYEDAVESHAAWYQVIINGYRNMRIANSLLKLAGDKANRLAKWAETDSGNEVPVIGGMLPTYTNSKYRKRDAYINTSGVYFEQITNLSILHNVQTYDFTVPGNHNFVANDFVVHNTAETGWMAKLGVNIEKLLIAQPESGEIASDLGVALLESKEVSLLVVDSVAALVPLQEYEASAEDNFVGIQSKLMAGFIRKITASLIKERLRKHEVTVIFVNQIRCLDVKTIIWSDKGLVPILDLRPGDYVESPSGYSEVINIVNSGIVEGMELGIRKHTSLKLSNNHRHIIVGPKGQAVERFASDIVIGDWVILSQNTRHYDKPTNDSDYRYAAFLGMYFADGCTSKSWDRNDYRVAISESNPERKSIVMSYMNNIFSGEGSYSGKNNSVGSVGKYIIDKYGIGYIGKDKVIPKAILKGSRETIVRFLQYASFDTHGFDEHGFIWTFETEEQANYVASLLKIFGIKADREQGRGREKLYSYLRLSGDDAIRYRDDIGFVEPSKKRASLLFVHSTSSGARGKYDVVPRQVFEAVFIEAQNRRIKGISSLPNYVALYACIANDKLNASRVRLLDFAIEAAKQDSYFSGWVDTLSKVKYAQITYMNPCSFEAVDIEVDGGLFYANGILTHNSKVGGFAKFGQEAISLPGGKALGHCTSLEIELKNHEIAGKSDADGTGIITHNEHVFNIKKNKMNNGERNGKYDLVRDYQTSTGLDEGDIDDAETVLSYAKNIGIYSGSGAQKKVLDLEEKTISAARDMDIIKIMNEDSDVYWLARTLIIRKIAENRGMDSDFIATIDAQKKLNLRRKN